MVTTFLTDVLPKQQEQTQPNLFLKFKHLEIRYGVENASDSM